MAEDRMAVLETVRKAMASGDVDFLREGMRVLAQAILEVSEVTGLTHQTSIDGTFRSVGAMQDAWSGAECRSEHLVAPVSRSKRASRKVVVRPRRSSVEVGPPRRSALDAERPLDAALVEVHKVATEDAHRRLRAGVEAERVADAALAT
jgi:hypothetical protein